MCKTKRIILIGSCLLCLTILILSSYSWVGKYNEQVVRVDFNNPAHQMKELHGINNGPKSGYQTVNELWKLDATDLFQEMNIPIVRTHDSEYPYGQEKFIDIHCVFPDFSGDVEDPSAYNFIYSDQYIAAIIESGAKVFYRLGESIDPTGENRYTYPPEDYEKWARICEHIIRHYNEGWANGFQYGIEYWEIWNEPEVARQWAGSMEEYCNLYRITAKYLKQIYPDIKIGGCAMGTCTEETITDFLQLLTVDGQKTPLDFFSWHTYTNDPKEYADKAVMIRRILNENGYKNTLSFLDEWNYVDNWKDLTTTKEVIQSAYGAAFIASSLIMMQNSPIDSAMYYDGQFVGDDIIWCGLYKAGAEKLPGFYAFLFFNQMYQLGQQVKVDENLENIYCCAAAGEQKAILLVNYAINDASSVAVNLKFNCAETKASITRVNEENPNGVTEVKKFWLKQMILDIKPGEIIFIEFE